MTTSTAVWWGILAMAAGCYGLKLAGLSLPARVLTHPWTLRVSALIPAGLLGALIAVQVLGRGSEIVIDARVPALAVAVVALWWRASFLVVVLAAAVTAAVLRLIW